MLFRSIDHEFKNSNPTDKKTLQGILGPKIQYNVSSKEPEGRYFFLLKNHGEKLQLMEIIPNYFQLALGIQLKTITFIGENEYKQSLPGDVDYEYERRTLDEIEALKEQLAVSYAETILECGKWGAEYCGKNGIPF